MRSDTTIQRETDIRQKILLHKIKIDQIQEEKMKYYIGVDLGTSAVKLLLMDQEGQVVNIVSREYPLSFPHPGWSEQNPEDWWEQSKEGIRELISKIDAAEVAGISFGGQMHGLVILDEKDQVIRPAILWNDGRTTKETDYLNQVIGKEKLSEYTANIAFAGFTAPKLLWVKENEPENFAKICKIMLPKDHLPLYRFPLLPQHYPRHPLPPDRLPAVPALLLPPVLMCPLFHNFQKVPASVPC